MMSKFNFPHYDEHTDWKDTLVELATAVGMELRDWLRTNNIIMVNNDDGSVTFTKVVTLSVTNHNISCAIGQMADLLDQVSQS